MPAPYSGRQIDYTGGGLASARPASLNLFPGAIGFWYATDTGVLTVWDGTAWHTAGGGAAAPENKDARGVTLPPGMIATAAPAAGAQVASGVLRGFILPPGDYSNTKVGAVGSVLATVMNYKVGVFELDSGIVGGGAFVKDLGFITKTGSDAAGLYKTANTIGILPKASIVLLNSGTTSGNATGQTILTNGYPLPVALSGATMSQSARIEGTLAYLGASAWPSTCPTISWVGIATYANSFYLTP